MIFLAKIFGWVVGNSQFIIYAFAAIAIAGFGYKLYNTIRENAQFELIVETQKNTIADKNKQIVTLERDAVLKQLILNDRDTEINNLELKLENVLVDLGPDSKDAAPQSTKELFRRLRKAN